MIKISINIKEYNFLLNSIYLPFYWKKTINQSTEKINDAFIITVSEDQADELRDIFGEQLQIIGFDEKYKPTPEGEILESLIDKFYIE